MTRVWSPRSAHVHTFLLALALFPAACGGKSSRVDNSDGGSGGTEPTAASGGSTTTSGGSDSAATGGTSETSTGGTSTGGSDNAGTGGTSDDCKGVVCAPIPSSCKQVVQEPGACCPTCPDTGCTPCPDLVCDAGSHAETQAGDCCPTCQPNPPDACMQGQAAYQELRAALLSKYGSTGCQNSVDCTLAVEDNACASTCGVVLPASTVASFENNMTNAANACSACSPTPPPQCPAQVPTCVNGQCQAVLPVGQ